MFAKGSHKVKSVSNNLITIHRMQTHTPIPDTHSQNVLRGSDEGEKILYFIFFPNFIIPFV